MRCGCETFDASCSTSSFSSTNEKPESHKLNQDQVFSLKSFQTSEEKRGCGPVCPRSNCGGLQRDLNLHRKPHEQKPQLNADLTHFFNSAAPPCWGLTSPTTGLWYWFPSQQLAVRWEELKEDHREVNVLNLKSQKHTFKDQSAEVNKQTHKQTNNHWHNSSFCSDTTFHNSQSRQTLLWRTNEVLAPLWVCFKVVWSDLKWDVLV